MQKLFIGIQGKAVCLDKSTGNILWSAKLKSSSSVTNVYYEDMQVFAYSGGHLFCLNAETGEIVWENGLSGYGFGACIIASEIKVLLQLFLVRWRRNKRQYQALSWLFQAQTPPVMEIRTFTSDGYLGC